MTQQPLRELDRSWIDRFLFTSLTRGWSTDHITGYRENLRRHDTALSSDVMQAFDQIDSKATGLLTHVSVMIAGLGLIAPLIANSETEITIIVVQIAAYLLLAIGCLRCLSIFHMGEFSRVDSRFEQIVDHELIIRREVFRLCQRFSILLTMLVFVLLPILYFIKPGKS